MFNLLKRLFGSKNEPELFAYTYVYVPCKKDTHIEPPMVEGYYRYMLSQEPFDGDHCLPSVKMAYPIFNK